MPKIQENNYQAIVNPTFQTAQSTLQMLANCGDKYAQEYVRILGFHDLDESQPQNFDREAMPQFMTALSVSIEARYKMVNWLLQQSGYQNVLDLACGYTPRALHAVKNGLDYVGLDLPTAIEQLQPVCDILFHDYKHPLYVGGDVTNLSSMKNAADYLSGEVFISCEGLIGYLARTELDSMLYNIRQILLSHGGAWYSSDFEVNYGRMLAAGLGSQDAVQGFQKMLDDSKSKTDIYFNSAAFLNSVDKKQFIEDHGFSVEKICFYQETITLNALQALPEKQQTDVTELLKSFHVWKITANQNFKEKELLFKSILAGQLTIGSKLLGNVLQIQLGGRLDTLTAPDFLKFYDSVSEKNSIQQIKIDLKELDYISSAGLRTILIIAKKIGVENLWIQHANELVCQIFEDTGFSQILQMED